MAKLSDEIIISVLNLERKLLNGINEAKAIELAIFEIYGETEETGIVLEQLQNSVERLRNPYSRFCTLLLRIAEEQPLTSPAMLELLEQSIQQTQANLDAVEATIKEIKRDWKL